MDQKETDSVKSSGEYSESDHLRKIFRYVLGKWPVFVALALLAGLAGYLYARYQKVTYQSYLSFALDEGGSQVGGSAALGLAAQFGISLGGSQDIFSGDNILEIILSRRVVESTLLSVDTFDHKPVTLIEYFLQQQPSWKKGNTEGIHFPPGEPRSAFSYAQDSVLYNTYLLFKRSRIVARRPDTRLNIYELLVNSTSEKFTKDFTDRLIHETNNFYTEIRSKKARQTLDILERSVPSMKNKFDSAVSQKAAIQDANLNTAFENAQVPLIKQESNSQVYAAAYSEMFKDLEVARFQYLRSIPLLQVIDPADYPMQKIRQGRLKTALVFAVIADFILLMGMILLLFFKLKRMP
ncbi:MAG: hypothetical protein KGM98_03500 [Bacteroidota bacterium]|nr:hypothetical protein [Bacteroidota bacterium]